MKLSIFIFTIILTHFSCSSQKKTKTHFDITENSSLFKAIDHIPIVVSDLEEIKDLFKNQLHFTIKDGRTHEGIKNCFVKFKDGTYLEFIEPIDSLQTIGKYYANFLKIRQGATSLAISVSSGELVKKMLNENNTQYIVDSNKIWQTIEPKNFELFFIDYSDNNWKETPTNTTHLNTATSLNATYILTNNFETEIKKYKRLGVNEAGNGVNFETSYKQFKVGQSNFYILDGAKSRKIKQQFNKQNFQGICGVEIKVNSLQTFNQLTKQKPTINQANDRTTIFLKDYNLFLTFTE